MNLYAHDLSLFDFANFSDNPIMDHRSSFDSLVRHHNDFNSSDRTDGDDDGNIRASVASRRSPPKHRHDGTSPLPLGMDWSTPPGKWVFSLFSISLKFDVFSTKFFLLIPLFPFVLKV